MLATTSGYDDYNEADSRRPVFAVEFYTELTTIDTKFVSNDFADIDSPPGSVEYIKAIRGLRLVRPRIDFKGAQLVSGMIQIQIVDVNSSVTNFMNANSPFAGGVYVRVKSGFQEMAYDDFINLNLEGSICTNVSIEADLLTYTFEVRDNLYSLFRSVINGSSIYPIDFIDVTLTSGTTSLMSMSTSPVFTHAQQADLANLLDDLAFVCVKIENEIIEYETTYELVLDFRLETLTRGKGNSADLDHTVGAGGVLYANRGIGFECDPLRMLLHLLTTFNGTNGKYDIGDASFLGTNYWFMLPDPDGGYINEDFINWEAIEKLGWKYFHEYEYAAEGYQYYFINEKYQTMQHLADTVLKPHGLFFKLRDGKIEVGSLDRVSFYENFTTDFAFNTSNIIGIDSVEIISDEVLYDYIVNYLYAHATKQYIASDTDIANSSSPDVVRASKYVINHPGISTSYDAEQVKHAIKHRFSLMADTYTIVKVRANAQTGVVEPGDEVTITWPGIPDLSAGSRGWTNRKGMVIGQEFDYFAGSFVHEVAVFDHPATVENYISDVLYEVNKVVEGSINDKALSVSTGETATTEAADAYFDNSSANHEADRIIFKFRLTQPGYGLGSTQEILAIKISALDSGPAFLVSDYRRYIRFNPQSSDVMLFECDLYITDASPITPDRVKVDWISTTATGGEVPTLELIGVWFVKLNF